MINTYGKLWLKTLNIFFSPIKSFTVSFIFLFFNTKRLIPPSETEPFYLLLCTIYTTLHRTFSNRATASLIVKICFFILFWKNPHPFFHNLPVIPCWYYNCKFFPYIYLLVTHLFYSTSYLKLTFYC